MRIVCKECGHGMGPRTVRSGQGICGASAIVGILVIALITMYAKPVAAWAAQWGSTVSAVLVLLLWGAVAAMWWYVPILVMKLRFRRKDCDMCGERAWGWPQVDVEWF